MSDAAERAVEKAKQEVFALCKGKQWRMCIPAQLDDSDVVIMSALAALETENAELTDREARLGLRVRDLHAESVALKAEVDRLRGERDTQWRKFVALTKDEQIAELEKRAATSAEAGKVIAAARRAADDKTSMSDPDLALNDYDRAQAQKDQG
ncbi:MAG TPA: hypothetical protein VFB89_08530 [Gemmatimonadales bacterium]|nr:hypothetical protein [Gemmatimonadales bacterium]